MYVVAGATGHVGAVVAKELLSKGKKVKVLVRDAKKAEPWSKAGAEVAIGALDDAAFLTGALKGATGLFTLLPPAFAPPDMFALQCKMADAVAAAVTQAKVPHVVLLSSIGADLAQGTGPITGLHYFENKLRATGTQLTAIRAGSFQENIGNSIGAAKGPGIFPNFTPSADYPMPMIATKDIGQLAAQTLLAPAAKNEVVDLHGPAYSIRDQATMLGKALGKELKIIDIPPAGHVAALTDAGLPPHVAAKFAEMYAGFASGKITPKGDRLVTGKTTLDETLKALLTPAG